MWIDRNTPRKKKGFCKYCFYNEDMICTDKSFWGTYLQQVDGESTPQCFTSVPRPRKIEMNSQTRL